MTHEGVAAGREIDRGDAGPRRGRGRHARRGRATGQVTDVQLRIYEPPRFFEAFLRGRGHTEPPDITSRICGICPVAYEMSACRAIEDACGVGVPEEIALMRRLLYCGEWIESHTLHVYLLHAPDFLGYPGAIEMAADHRDVVERGLRLKKAGNALMTLVGGRAVHPVNVKVGGFYRFPDPRPSCRALRPQLAAGARRRARHRALAAGFDFPDFEQAYEYVSLRTDHGLPASRRARSSPAAARRSRRRLRRTGSPRSTCRTPTRCTRACATSDPTSSARSRGTRSTTTGSRRRPAQAADAAGLGPTCRNPFRSIVVRAVEIVVACEEALRIIDGWSDGGAPSVDGAAARRGRARRDRGAARRAVPPLRARRGRHRPRRADRAADVAEPGQHRGRPAGLRAGPAAPRHR